MALAYLEKRNKAFKTNSIGEACSAFTSVCCIIKKRTHINDLKYMGPAKDASGLYAELNIRENEIVLSQHDIIEIQRQISHETSENTDPHLMSDEDPLKKPRQISLSLAPVGQQEAFELISEALNTAAQDLSKWKEIQKHDRCYRKNHSNTQAYLK